MTRLLLDTHTWVWSLLKEARLSGKASVAILSADEIYLSSVTVYEIAQKVRLGKWAAMEQFAPVLPEIMRMQGIDPVPVTPEIAKIAGALSWPHRDPFDRMIAATALVNDLTLVSADTAFDTVPGGLTRIW